MMPTLRTASPSELSDLAMMVADTAWKAKDYAASKRAAQLARDLDPGDVDALSRLGRISLLERDYPRAAEYFERAFDELPSAAAAVNLAIAYGAQKDFTAALGWCGLALKHDPRFLPAYIHAAALLEEQGKLYAAEEYVRYALDVFPENAELIYALALYQLRRGDFEHGWPNYEYRAPRLDLARKLDEYPEWKGEPLEGKTILVCGEQGIGDQIMFVRYVPLVAGLGANVVLFTLPSLARLFAEATTPEIRILASDAELKGIEPDYWVAIGSLPLRWRQFEDIDVVGTPRQDEMALPYLWPDRAAVDRFARLVAGKNLKVGLCWQGNPEHRRDEYRSMRFEDLKPLLNVRNVDFYSLQRGDTSSGLVNLTEYCHDLADTAAAVASLDLVITVDTAMLHLAGAMGVPVWGLMYTPGDWRWSEGEKTSWYASARLYRQQKQCEWTSEIRAIAADLRERAALPRIYTAPLPANSDAPVARQCRYGAMTWPANDHYIGRALDLYGEYSESEVELLRRVLKPGDIVVEAGANVGGLTIPMADLVGPRGTVFAFEPQSFYYRHLERNADRFFEDRMANTVIQINAALGHKSGTLTMRAVEEEKIHAPGWPSTGPEFEVRGATIDGLGLNSCALIKIDVDGPEHEILLGAERTIDRCRPLLYVEYDKPAEYPEMLPWIAAKGYRLYRHAAPLFNPSNFRNNPVNVFGSIVSLMVLAVPDERKDLHPCDWGLERIREEA